MDLDGFASPATSSGVGHQLGVTTFFKAPIKMLDALIME